MEHKSINKAGKVVIIIAKKEGENNTNGRNRNTYKVHERGIKTGKKGV